MAPLLLLLCLPFALAGHDYGQALSKSILFFEAQRSGFLPRNQRVTWRSNSGLYDGKANGVDLVGGYYDAGDNVKFGLPMAFTVTMMSWSIIEYGKQMAASGELGHAMEAVKWGTDYFIKAHPEPNVLYGEVGDGNTDHYCWQRPEDMTTNRRAYKISPSNPGSDLAGETAAAMAAASIVFRRSNPAYSRELLRHAYQGSRNAQKTPGGLIYRQRWNNMQFVTSSSFLITVYSDYLTSSRRTLKCASGNVAPNELLSFAKSQVDYILGDNPRATSYMVGYGNNYPQQVHHRASSIVSYKKDSSFVSCRGGYATWFSRKASDPNLLTGAIVGGPDAYDNFADQRDNYEQTEPATYNNAPLLVVPTQPKSAALPKPKAAPEPKVTPATPAPSSSPIAISQRKTTSWTSKGVTYYRYSAIVTNKSAKTLTNLKLSVSKLYGPIWGLTKAGNSYVFPSWINSLPAGKSMEFVYIHSASPANVLVSSYSLA
ncbi:hypothetical protein C1H46_012577 [Malus baccata]|uniref:Endoglucanase n=1 Tax=Malus baccata TaxID=106549 RepID=A0A540MSK3_MALBA|nr:hypothetical protein C1H46_012577 [Malus baccata]